MVDFLFRTNIYIKWKNRLRRENNKKLKEKSAENISDEQIFELIYNKYSKDLHNYFTEKIKTKGVKYGDDYPDSFKNYHGFVY